jgi:4a-hydroxytetrahydrobiopterin dehydratase
MPAREKTPLNDTEIEDALTELEGWICKAQTLERVYKTGNFNDGLALVNAIAEAADEANHHPDIFLSFPKVKVQLITHDVGTITQLDVDMAKKVNEIALSQGVF